MESLIFVALAVAWLVYLVPKGLKMHEESKQLDAVEDFSDDLRVVARRDAGATADTELTVPDTQRPKARAVAQSTAAPVGSEHTTPEHTTPEQPTASEAEEARPEPARVGRWGRVGRAFLRGLRAAMVVIGRVVRAPVRVGAGFVSSRSAARADRAPLSPAGRRRRVLGSLLLLTVVVAVLAGLGVVSWWGLALPVALTAAWLVACRLMVVGERTRRTGSRPTGSRTPRTPRPPRTRGPRSTEETLVGAVLVDDLVELDADEPLTPYVSGAAPTAPGSWEMVPMTLPTYVTKDAAEPRTPQPFRLDSTGVWSSGRSESDSEIARRAEQDAAAARERLEVERERKLGS